MKGTRQEWIEIFSSLEDMLTDYATFFASGKLNRKTGDIINFDGTTFMAPKVWFTRNLILLLQSFNNDSTTKHEREMLRFFHSEGYADSINAVHDGFIRTAKSMNETHVAYLDADSVSNYWNSLKLSFAYYLKKKQGCVKAAERDFIVTSENLKMLAGFIKKIRTAIEDNIAGDSDPSAQSKKNSDRLTSSYVASLLEQYENKRFRYYSRSFKNHSSDDWAQFYAKAVLKLNDYIDSNEFHVSSTPQVFGCYTINVPGKDGEICFKIEETSTRGSIDRCTIQVKYNKNKESTYDIELSCDFAAGVSNIDRYRSLNMFRKIMKVDRFVELSENFRKENEKKSETARKTIASKDIDDM